MYQKELHSTGLSVREILKPCCWELGYILVLSKKYYIIIFILYIYSSFAFWTTKVKNTAMKVYIHTIRSIYKKHRASAMMSQRSSWFSKLLRLSLFIHWLPDPPLRITRHNLMMSVSPSRLKRRIYFKFQTQGIFY